MKATRVKLKLNAPNTTPADEVTQKDSNLAPDIPASSAPGSNSIAAADSTSATGLVQRRRQYVVDKDFQHRFIWRFVMVMIASMFFSQLLILGYIKIKEWVDPTSQNLIYFADTIHDTLAFTRILEVVWLPLLLSAVVGSIFVLFFALLYSHRMAGPLFNLKRVMQQVEEGNLRVTMRIRKKDEFHDVETAFNKMVRGLNAYLVQLNEAVGKLPAESRKKLADILKEIRVEGLGE